MNSSKRIRKTVYVPADLYAKLKGRAAVRRRSIEELILQGIKANLSKEAARNEKSPLSTNLFSRP